jgi:hypothetical protein
MPNTGAESRRRQRVATPAAAQNTNHENTGNQPKLGHDPREPKLTNTDHQPPLAASTTNRRRQPKSCDRRLDTTVHPHGIRPGDVAITVPAETTQKALKMRWYPPHSWR